MTRSKFARFIPALLVLLPLAATAGLLVTDISGLAEVDGRGRLALMAELPDGAALNVAAGAHVVAIDLGSGREYLLKAGRYTVDKSGPSEGGKPVASSALPAGKLPAVKIATSKVAQATLVMRSARKVVPVLSPNNTAVSSLTPTLRWPENADATAYRIAIRGLAGVQVFESLVPRQASYVLPSAANLQAGEQYEWRVDAMRESQALTVHNGKFSVLGAIDIYRLGQFRAPEGAEFSRRVLYAALLMEAGASDEARLIWQVLRAERPDDASLAKLAE